MAVRLPTSRAIREVAAPDTRRDYRVPTPAVRQSSGVMTAAAEILDTIREAHTESEVRRTDIETALALDKVRRDLETEPDWENYEAKFATRAQEILSDRERSLSTPEGRLLFRARGQERLGQGIVSVRDLARRRGSETAVAGLVRQDALARQVIDDDSADDKLRAESVLSYTEMVRSMVGRGIVAADDGERMIASTAGYLRERTEQRSVVAGAQQAADRVFSDPKLETLDQKLAWVRENMSAGRAREAAEDEVAQRAQRERVARETQEEADRIAWMRAENGDGELPPDVRSRIEQTQPEFVQARGDRRRALYREGIANMEAERRRQQILSQDRADGLMADALADPRKMQALVSASPEALSRLTATLEPDDALRLSQFRARASGRVGPDEQAQLIEKVFADLKVRAEPVATLRLRNYGGESGTGATNKAQLQRYLLGVSRDFVSRYGRAPTEGELETLVSRAFEEQRTRNEFGDKFEYRFGRPPPLPITEEEAKP